MTSLLESCLCCALCKPHYLRLVDNIYPRTLTDGLVAANMTKLTFYTITHPEKLNRIGVYLLDRLSRDLYRQRYVQVKVCCLICTYSIKAACKRFLAAGRRRRDERPSSSKSYVAKLEHVSWKLSSNGAKAA